jgi:outer membrane protein assembly factor BamB
VAWKYVRVGVAVGLAVASLAPVAPARASHVCAQDPSNVHPCSHDPPSASFTWSPANPKRRETVTFTGSASANPDRKIESVRWDLYDDDLFEDGTELTAERTFYSPGSTRVRLRVEDSEGAVTIASDTVTVTEPSFDLSRPASSIAYQANPFRDGFVDAPTPAPPLARKWSRALGERVSYPVIVDGRVFVTARDEDTFGTTVYALDRRTGAILWSRPVGGGAATHPVYDDGRLILFNASGLVLAVDPASGRSLWARQQSQTSVRSMPLAYGGLVWTSGGGVGGTVYGVDGRDGTLVWTQGLVSGDGSPAIDGNNLYIAHECNGIYGMDRFTGFAQWWYRPPGCGSSGSPGRTPVVHDGLVYGRQDRDDGQTLGWVVRTADGAAVGEFKADEAPAFKGEVGLFLHSGVLRAQNTANGTDLWAFAGDGQLATAPLIVGDFASIGSKSGKVYALDLSTGQPAWIGEAGGDIESPAEGHRLVAGLGAGDGTLIVPAGGTVVAFGAPGEDSTPGRDARGGPVSGLAPPAPGGGQSTTLQVNAAHDGFLNVAHPAPPLREVWTQRVGESAGYPIVADGKAFGYDRRGDRLWAFDLRTGRELWSRTTSDEGFYARTEGAAYDDGKLFVVANGRTIAYRATDGAELWTATGITDPPVAGGGHVYGSGGGSIKAIRQADGSRAWSAPVIGGTSMPAFDGGRAYVSYACLNASAHDRATGAAVWAIHPIGCSGGGGSTPAVHGGRLYAREHGAVYALDPDSGRVVDNYSAEAPPAFAGNVGLFLNGTVLQAIELGTGEPVWSFRDATSLRTPPLIVGRHVYVGSRNGLLHALRLETGKVAWSTGLESGFPPDEVWEREEHYGFAAGDGYLVVASSRELVAFAEHGGLAIDVKAAAKRLAKARRAKLLRKRGFTIELVAPGPGTFGAWLEGPGRARLTIGSRKAGRGGAALLTLRATARGRALMRDGRRLRAVLRVRFQPRKGRASSAARRLTLRD